MNSVRVRSSRLHKLSIHEMDRSDHDWMYEMMDERSTQWCRLINVIVIRGVCRGICTSAC